MLSSAATVADPEAVRRVARKIDRTSIGFDVALTPSGPCHTPSRRACNVPLNWNASKAPGREGQEGEGGRRADRPTNRQMHEPAVACGGHSALPVGVVCNWRCLSVGRSLILSRCLVRYYVGRTVQVCWQTREGGKPTNCAPCWQTREGGGVAHYWYLPGRYRLAHNAIGHCGFGGWSMGHCGFGDCPIGLWLW